MALEKYYETAGKNDPLRIDIPTGGYVPTFMKHRTDNQHPPPEKTATFEAMVTWPAILVRLLTNLTANPEDDYLSIGLTAELAHALSHYREIRVLEALHRTQKSPSPEIDFDFIIEGNVRRDPAGVSVAIWLRDTKNGIRIWSGKYQGDLEAAKMISFQEDVAAEVAVRVAGDNAVITRHLAGISPHKAASELTTYEAMLRFWESATLLTPQSMMRTIRALEHALAREPDNGQIWSMLASQYANSYGLEFADLSKPLERAAEFALRGVRLDPTNRRARMILAYVRLLQNRLREARYEAETAHNLCPNSLMVLDTIGWVMALAGDWESGVAWIEKAIKLNPYYRSWVRHAACINRFRVGNYEKAYRESLHFVMPKLFWEPLLKAAVCGHLERIEEGQKCARALLELKPDFAQRGRILIGRYVKFEDIVDRIVEGLGKLGMNIES